MYEYNTTVLLSSLTVSVRDYCCFEFTYLQETTVVWSALTFKRPLWFRVHLPAREFTYLQETTVVHRSLTCKRPLWYRVHLPARNHCGTEFTYLQETTGALSSLTCKIPLWFGLTYLQEIIVVWFTYLQETTVG